MMGRVIIIMNSVLWSLKFVEYLSVYRLIGPYIKTASEMVRPSIFFKRFLLSFLKDRTDFSVSKITFDFAFLMISDSHLYSHAHSYLRYHALVWNCTTGHHLSL